MAKGGDVSVVTQPDSAKDIVIAYEGGRKLDPAESQKAVEESLKKAETLMAMAETKKREDELKQEFFMHLISDKEWNGIYLL